MKKYLVVLISMLGSISLMGQTNTWVNDPAHSRLGFVVKHLTISEISGRFADFSVKVTTSKPDYMDAQIEVTAKIASMDTGVEMRDNHLRSADFFDAEKYPTLTFKSTSVEKTGKDKGKLHGNLTFHGITKPVVVDVVYFGTVNNPMNNATTAGFQIKGIVKRSDFDLGPKFPEAMVSNDVHIIADVEFSPSK